MRNLCIGLIAVAVTVVAQGFSPAVSGVAQGFSPAVSGVVQGFSPALSAATPQRGAGAPAAGAPAPQRGGGGRAGGAPAGPPNARAQAPIDLTGYWVSLITEDWRYRMMTAPKGDHPGIPLSAEGNRVANAWDPAKDEAAGEQCKAYGAGGVMRAPGKLHITWDGDATLKIETEAGTQTRLFQFGAAAAPVATNAAGGATGVGTWQGVSAAQWETGAGGRGRGRGGAAQGGDLKVVTTRMKPGYSQKNGVPYGENAVLTEYFTRTTEPNGDTWLLITSLLDDSQYQSTPFIRSTQFKKLPDSASTSWAPEACSAR